MLRLFLVAIAAGLGVACTSTSVGIPGVGGAGGVDVKSGALPSCANGKQDEGETDVDCGPACGVPCGDGLRCSTDDGCVSGACRGGTCAEASCSDHLQNGTETDVDCGGACPKKCKLMQHCGGDGDCAQGACSMGLCTPGCTDGRIDGDESDVDCGGSCPLGCGAGLLCHHDGDCAGHACNTGTGKCDATCTDGQKSPTLGETDVDCGGMICPKCPNGALCGKASDCQSNNCVGIRCQSP
jgi:hypothetical protein